MITVERNCCPNPPKGLFRKYMGGYLNSMANPWLEIDTWSEKEQQRGA
jgi:hypothetical protein